MKLQLQQLQLQQQLQHSSLRPAHFPTPTAATSPAPSTLCRNMRSLVVVLIVGVSLVFAEVTLVDLTHRLGMQTIYWPSNPPFNFTVLANKSAYGTVVNSNFFHSPEHIGTHMDAPRHFCPRGRQVHEFSIDQLSGPGVVLDFRSQAAQNYDYLVTLQDVKDWEAKHGLIPTGAVVLFNYGWNQYWPNWEKVFNTDNIQNFSSFHWPGLSLEASSYVAGTRKARAVGGDMPSGDPGQAGTKDIHINLLCDHGVIILENVGNIDALPTKGFRVYIGALPLENGSGTPIRLFAVLDDKGDTSGSRETTPAVLTLWGVLLLAMTLIYM